MKYLKIFLLVTASWYHPANVLKAQPFNRLNQHPWFLIAHRGGVVDSNAAENSMPALQRAVEHGYYMVEVDLRTTKDGELIIQHDPDFKRYFHVNKRVTDMDWKDIRNLRSDRGGSRVLQFEEVLKYCSGKIQLMIDNKISGNDTILFQKVVNLLSKYNLQTKALMIGTTESTAFFTGKIRLSCTREQLEKNMQMPDYNSENYYLFGADLTKDDVQWAVKNKILAVGVVNEWRYRRAGASQDDIKKDIRRLTETGLQYFQIDSIFEHFFMKSGD